EAGVKSRVRWRRFGGRAVSAGSAWSWAPDHRRAPSACRLVPLRSGFSVPTTSRHPSSRISAARRRVAILVAALLMVVASAARAAAAVSTPAPAANPVLPAACGLALAISLALSDSVSNTQLQEMKDAVGDLFDELAGYPIRFAVLNFASLGPSTSA